jgi:hypothetical protein
MTKTNKTIPRSIRFTDEQLKQIKAVAAQYDLTESHIIRRATVHYLSLVDADKSLLAPMP